jgi:hypothetical protein
VDSNHTKIFSQINNKEGFTNFANSGKREGKNPFFLDNNKEIYEFSERDGTKKNVLGCGPDTFGNTIGVEI